MTTFKIDNSDKSLAEAPSKIKSTVFDEIEIDLSKLKFIRPRILVRVRSIIEYLQINDLNYRITYPDDKDCHHYAGRMGLYEGTEYTYPSQYHESTDFFSLKKIDSDRNQSIYEVCLDIFQHSNATTNYITRVADAFGELADNIYFHSGEKENTGWGYIQAQAYQQRGIIRLGLNDIGVGIYGSYKRTGQTRNRSESDLVKSVFEESESSLNPPNTHRGIGLYSALEFIKLNTGHLQILTGNVKIDANQIGIYDSKSNFKTEGTWISMSVPIR